MWSCVSSNQNEGMVQDVVLTKGRGLGRDLGIFVGVIVDPPRRWAWSWGIFVGVVVEPPRRGVVLGVAWGILQLSDETMGIRDRFLLLQFDYFGSQGT